MQILPAIDLRGGKCVNLVQGIAEQETVFSDSPVDMAKQWQTEGAEYLHLVDLDGAFQGVSANLDIVREIVTELSIPVQLGGGIRSIEQIEDILAIGVDRVILGTAALRQPSLVKAACEKHGKRIAVGIDAKDGRVATHGWLEVSQKPAVEFAVEMAGVQTVIYTDIKSDGMLKGPNVETTAEIINAISADVIASGGVTSLCDVEDLKRIGASGAIIGRALYTGDLALQDAIAAAR
ncbi:1-(5-phosphoribosyl)-5-[(5-phosphoribosylamino)methylideneamino]imidazole-4-carboxamide isomerase [Candidatus Poribacteria bacterium]|nr:1-(5-phosphoribosyl)-5-[(5-phosphoribosylamino)methylideneamino]imidazole-4-carboxamide isomerase [Candidatus Poribacteria bacterium]MYB65598.1 1-(5-phosphoribosyl)-5-[(5-phosphoribosylamino)methylideneamino]imidazole-4-carboxamide isomerase [Candidatus Poribacteria bacterium]MYF55749.1 1-(5-phosphoribosyl)-5-[(5-phosphoribosylamino)methylideneamino]imidazole-4-carboxamide isomerase [Candidatus Poribacteria bacterium]MYI93585.1 1-(5-phosphoribosyl)-5-[(5-phosphoribosylamino)methylideneamino]i